MASLIRVLQGNRNNDIILSMDKPGNIQFTILLCILAEFFNLLTAWILGDILHIPLFMDTIGTVFIVFYAGLVPGLLVGGLYNILRLFLMVATGHSFYPWEMMYSFCGLVIAFFTWLFSWQNRNMYISRTLTILYLILISLITAFASSLVGGAIETSHRIYFDNQLYVNPVKNFVMAFLGENLGLFVARTFARIPVSVLDRLISTFVGFSLYQLAKKRFLSDARQ